jgi:hypothetical protein
MRLLKADEIDCRVGTSTDKGVSLLLYKDARVDMRILDETYGAMNWQRRHDVVNGNLFCTIEVWDNEKGCWVSKQDVGTESNTEKEKGEASDSFKRAGFNWGIGRELYTAPFIWITTTSDDLDNRGKIKTKFFVREIDYNEQNEINHLVIVDGKGNARFTFGKVKGDSGKMKAADKQEVTLEEAIAEMYACETLDAVKACWSKYPQFKNNDLFKQACTEQGFKTQNK